MSYLEIHIILKSNYVNKHLYYNEKKNDFFKIVFSFFSSKELANKM